jgi:acyl carrier protein
MDLLDRVQAVFRDVFDNENLLIDQTTGPGDIEDWDSFAHIGLVAALEKEFAVKLKIADIVKLTDVASILAFLSEKGKN